jgi:hypothetical protein
MDYWYSCGGKQMTVVHRPCAGVAAFNQVLPAKQQLARYASFTWWWDKQSKEIKVEGGIQGDASYSLEITMTK